MTLPITPDVLEGAYEYLRRTRPFCGWNLPEPDDIKFMVCRNRHFHGKHGWVPEDPKSHAIHISTHFVGATENLMMTMAHEMIHLHMAQAGMWLCNPHGKAFQRYAAAVCRFHGWDAKIF